MVNNMFKQNIKKEKKNKLMGYRRKKNKKNNVREKNKNMCQRKTESSILTGSKPQCLVRLQAISILTEFLFKEALQHQTREIS